MALRTLGCALLLLLFTVSPSYSDHERFIVGEMRMRNVDPSVESIVSVSGACIPSHDRERLDCYFTRFTVFKAKSEEQLKREYQDGVALLQTGPSGAQALKSSLCDDKASRRIDPLRLKYNVWTRKVFTALDTFCKRPTEATALAFFQASMEAEAKRCRCVVGDWRSTFVRQNNRWVENFGPEGLCGAITVSTLVPYDLEKMNTPTGPVLWTLHQRVVVTPGADTRVCAEGLFKVRERAMTASWDAPSPSIDCGEIAFTSEIEGILNPRKR